MSIMEKVKDSRNNIGKSVTIFYKRYLRRLNFLVVNGKHLYFTKKVRKTFINVIVFFFINCSTVILLQIACE